MLELMALLIAQSRPLPIAGAQEVYAHSVRAIVPLGVRVTKGFPERFFANNLPAIYAFSEAVGADDSSPLELAFPGVLQIMQLTDRILPKGFGSTQQPKFVQFQIRTIPRSIFPQSFS